MSQTHNLQINSQEYEVLVKTITHSLLACQVIIESFPPADRMVRDAILEKAVLIDIFERLTDKKIERCEIVDDIDIHDEIGTMQ